ncbi:glycosyltransferase family 2 protein [Nonomuraea rhizosphaerae]|uniref:glycosyltransferase family 2 protein n=1 Tax=Nonomuraea rhizosphaerae TaxID=2665663 RepID=UPI001C5E2017|nr:glycosyltransferase [Nonomuraea rhizosphaerae]
MMPMLSVVVPVYNVEPYITECLKSLAVQTLRDIEVIVVDDGSVDGSAAVAAEFAARDPRFSLVGQPNQGPGPARNTGIRLARGAYLAFADGDDVVPPRAYELLVGSLRQSGSDLACGGVLRLREGGLGASSLHERAFRRHARRSHILERRVLVRDRTVWNKVYRGDFWREHGLEFPAGIYEDVPLSMRAHVLAAGVDVLPDVVYHWREREEGETSITQRRAELPNLAERLTAIRAVRAFLAGQAPELIDAFDGLVLEKDVVFLFQALERAEGEEVEALLDLADEWLDGVSRAALGSVPSLRRLELHLLRRGLVEELREVRRFRRERADGVRVVPRGLRSTGWYGDYPYFRDRTLRIPDSVFDARDELRLLATVDECRWTGGAFQVRGQVAIQRVDRRPGRVRLWLGDGRLRVPLDVRRTGARGFVTAIDPRRLEGGGPSWRLYARAETRGLVLKGCFRDGQARKAWRLSVPGWSRTGMDMPQ